MRKYGGLVMVDASLTGQSFNEAMIEQRLIGHAEGQMHTIADVNACKLDDLIAPRLALERKAVIKIIAEALQHSLIDGLKKLAE